MPSRCPSRRLDRLCVSVPERYDPSMLTVSADGVDAALTFEGLVETLREAFRAGAVQPVGITIRSSGPTGAASTLLLMPAWTDFNAAGARAAAISASRSSPSRPTTTRSASPR